jgi:hypothetical protein
MSLRDLLSRLRALWRAVVSHGRNYGCLPEDIEARHPEQRPQKPAPNRPESANSVEKDKPLR